MLDGVTLALPMIQVMSGLGAHGSLELTRATGLHLEVSIGYGVGNSSSASAAESASEQTRRAPYLGLPLGLPTLPAPDLSGLHGLVEALGETGKALGTVAEAVGSATQQIVKAWTGPAAEAALAVVKDIALHSTDLEEKNNELSQATSAATAIVSKAASQIAGVIAKFLSEAASSLAAVETVIGTPIAIIAAALNACKQVADIFMAALAELQEPTLQVLRTAQDARLNIDIKLPLALPSLQSLAKVAGAVLTPRLSTIQGSIALPGVVDIGGAVGGGLLPSGHIAWGRDAGVRETGTYGKDHSALNSAPSTAPVTQSSSTALHGYSSPTGMQSDVSTTSGTTQTSTSTGSGVSYTPPTGGENGAATSKSAPAATTTGVSYTPDQHGTSHASSSHAPASTAATTTACGVGDNAGSAQTHSVSNAQSHSTGSTQVYGVSNAQAHSVNGDFSSSAAGTSLPITLPDGSTVYAPNAAAAQAIKSALSQVGVPYVWGTTGTELDGSNLTQWAYQQAGVDISGAGEQGSARESGSQESSGAHQSGAAHNIPLSDALPGDLLLCDGYTAMLVGNGLMLKAGDPVTIAPLPTDTAEMAVHSIVRPWLKAE